MAQNKPKRKGLRISQLAKLAGVPIPTIKHYLNEGLLPRPTKTGRTMSYYGNDCIDRVRLIKRLRTDRFLPLSVIKRIIESGASLEGEVALGEALMNVSALAPSTGATLRRQIAKETEYPLSKIDKMEALGLIRPRMTPRGKEYDQIDCKIISLMRQREEAGLPFDYSLEMMSMYRAHIRQIVKEDARLFVRRMLKNTSASDAARYVREGDKALAAFMPLIKAKLVSSNAETLVEELNAIPDRLEESLRFRSPRTLSEMDSGQPRRVGSESRLTLLFAAIRGKNKRAVPESTICSPEIMSLMNGISDLVAGRAAEALLCFSRAVTCEAILPLAQALSGLAHMARIPQAPGVLSPMHAITDGIASFDASRGHSSDPETTLLYSYLRGVGLAIIPEIFDTHHEAAADLRAVIDSANADAACRDAGLKRLCPEIRAKAAYFLAQMYLCDENYDAAYEILDSMKKKCGSGFYGKWARRQLHELNKSQKENKQ
ncbi:MerR family transcriptional regulator [Candidatus Poribacteria bacterium]|nr:MerR family transcriptional regulator [Candidatus Poribacteria bacterium]